MTQDRPTPYTLRCRRCGTELADDGIVLSHGGCNPPGLLQTIYGAERPGPGDESMGLFQYRDWLPARRTLCGSSAPVAYRSRGLAARLQLENLFITFSGYWPERGVLMRTCTFKELEAYAVCARLPDNFSGVLVVASAGNTARAFLRVCSQQRVRTLVVVPERSIPMLWHHGEHDDCVRVIAAGGDCDYADAISLAERICSMDGFVAEGGVRNVARRDGLGTTVLSCAAAAGRVPDEYFQAVGSGTGAIAAWEASERLCVKAVRPGGAMRLNVAQNLPLAPIYESWACCSSRLVWEAPSSGGSADELYAGVLFNRRPPYEVAGGLYDALRATNGRAYGISNEEAIAAAELFEAAEGIDVDPAAAVAVACLRKCAANGDVQKDAWIMLNVTGGGMKRLEREVSLQTVRPAAVIGRLDFHRAHSFLLRKGVFPSL